VTRWRDSVPRFTSVRCSTSLRSKTVHFLACRTRAPPTCSRTRRSETTPRSISRSALHALPSGSSVRWRPRSKDPFFSSLPFRSTMAIEEEHLPCQTTLARFRARASFRQTLWWYRSRRRRGAVGNPRNARRPPECRSTRGGSLAPRASCRSLVFAVWSAARPIRHE
jgi:hypothetical protein